VPTDIVAREARARRLLVLPESRCRFNASRPGTHLRSGYASRTPEEVIAGMDLLLASIAATTSK
jgi:hypothetical protein